MNLACSSVRNRERGATLIELLVAMFILAVGMGAVLVLFMNATVSNNKNLRDTGSTLLAQMILEQISSQHPNSTADIIVTDCTGVQWTVASAGAVAPNGQGATLDQNAASATYGGIDQTQAYNAIPANYAMQYTDCDTNGQQNIYEIRWNVITITANSTRLITVSARQANLSSNQLGGAKFALPVTLRAIGGT